MHNLQVVYNVENTIALNIVQLVDIITDYSERLQQILPSHPTEEGWYSAGNNTLKNASGFFIYTTVAVHINEREWTDPGRCQLTVSSFTKRLFNQEIVLSNYLIILGSSQHPNEIRDLHMENTGNPSNIGPSGLVAILKDLAETARQKV